MKSDKSDKPGKPARQPAATTLTRRAFIKGAGAAAAAVASLGAAVAPADAAGQADAANSDGVVERLGPGAQTYELNINAKTVQVTAEPRVTLLEALRDSSRSRAPSWYATAARAAPARCISTATRNLMHGARGAARGHQITTIEGLGTLTGCIPCRPHSSRTTRSNADSVRPG